MALFGSGRDASLIRLINRELINRVIDTEIELFKVSLTDTPENLYGEGVNKVYFNPIRLPCLIQRDEKSVTADVVVDYIRTATFLFLRDTLADIPVVIAGGDIIRYNAEYYEVTQTESNQYWAGKNPLTNLGDIYSEILEHGYDTSVIVSTIKVTPTALNLVDVRSGINPNTYFPNNI